jgi:putative transposase
LRVMMTIGVKTLYIEPGSPRENGYVESFNGRMRDELLEREIFDTLLEAKVLIERWRVQYNTVRPHSSLGSRPPAPATVWVGRKDGGVPPAIEGFSPPEDTVARKPLSSDEKKLVRLT